MSAILVVEDNKDVNLMLKEALIQEGYEVKSLFSGLGIINEVKNFQYDLILLDMMLPYKSGDAILIELRRFTDIPVIIVSAKDMVGTKIDLLKLGADDYITKPFDLDEVVARVQSNLRRFMKQVQVTEQYQYKDMLLDSNAKRVTIFHTELELTTKEFMILEMLMKHKDKVFTKANLYESIWSEEYLGDSNSIKTHMSNLRNKINRLSPDDEYIETVWGLGYRLYKE